MSAQDRKKHREKVREFNKATISMIDVEIVAGLKQKHLVSRCKSRIRTHTINDGAKCTYGLS